MKIGIYPGSFDPITNGHLDMITRAAALVDELIVAVLINPKKGAGLLKMSERLEVLEEATRHLDNVKVDSFSGLLVDYAKAQQATVLIRGLRDTADFLHEMSMAQMNRSLSQGLETIFLVSSPEHSYVSSSAVREMIFFGGAYENFVPAVVSEKLKNKKDEGVD